jgi:transcription elongation factor Elf1
MEVEINNNYSYNKLYYLKNRDKILVNLKQKIDCHICGKQYLKSCQNNHNKSKHHLQFMQCELCGIYFKNIEKHNHEYFDETHIKFLKQRKMLDKL